MRQVIGFLNCSKKNGLSNEKYVPRKRPRDFSQAGILVVDIAAEEVKTRCRRPGVPECRPPSRERSLLCFAIGVGSPASTRSLSKRGPHSQAHLTMTPVASVYPDSCVASFRKDLDGRNVHFFAALAGRAFSAAGHQQALELRH
jgi:hypothetical protein